MPRILVVGTCISFALIVAACEGPVGPRGERGPAGEPGEDGDPVFAIYQIRLRETSLVDSTVFSWHIGPCDSTYIVQETREFGAGADWLDQAVVEHGIVLFYALIDSLANEWTLFHDQMAFSYSAFFPPNAWQHELLGEPVIAIGRVVVRFQLLRGFCFVYGEDDRSNMEPPPFDLGAVPPVTIRVVAVRSSASTAGAIHNVTLHSTPPAPE